MYNFNLYDDENVVKIFDEVLIRQNDKQRITSIVLTNKRLLFYDFVNSDPAETLRTARGMYGIRTKEVSYIIDLNNIESIEKGKYYLINLKDNISFEFDSEELYNLLSK